MRVTTTVYIRSYFTILPKTEDWIEQNEDIFQTRTIQQHLEEHYDNLVDMFLCVLFPSMKKYCMDFYTGGGSSLEKLFSKKRVAKIDQLLLENLRRISEDMSILEICLSHETMA